MFYMIKFSMHKIDDLKLHKLFTNAIPHFYYYSVTKINKEDWKSYVRFQ